MRRDLAEEVASSVRKAASPRKRRQREVMGWEKLEKDEKELTYVDGGSNKEENILAASIV